MLSAAYIVHEECRDESIDEGFEVFVDGAYADLRFEKIHERSSDFIDSLFVCDIPLQAVVC